MHTTTENQYQITVAARVAGEDIKQGDFVAILHEVFEIPSFLWASSGVAVAPDEPVRCRYLSTKPGRPYKVTAVCLPFIYVKTIKGKLTAFDVRLKQLVRLDREIGLSVWKKLRKQARPKQQKKSN